MYMHVYRWFIDPASITKEATLHQNVATSIHHLHVLNKTCEECCIILDWFEWTFTCVYSLNILRII